MSLNTTGRRKLNASSSTNGSPSMNEGNTNNRQFEYKALSGSPYW